MIFERILNKYIEINIDFGEKLEKAPTIFSVNYFLKDRERTKFLNSKLDKMVWLKWMELRVNRDIEAIDIGTGFIPEYEDLSMLFRKYLKKDYIQEDYIKQFTLRLPENIEKIDRMINIYKSAGPEVPDILFDTLQKQKEKLQAS